MIAWIKSVILEPGFYVMPNCFSAPSVRLTDMTESLEVVEGEALSSSGVERSQLVEHVLASLESDPTFQSDWLVEAGRRYKEFFAGCTRSSLGSAVHARLRSSIE